MIVFSDFESGAIDLINWDNGILRVSLTMNQRGEVNHWFYFGVKESPQNMTIVFENGMLSRFAKGWHGYRPFISVDNIKWERCNSVFDIEGMTISIILHNLPEKFFLAWFPPCVPQQFKEYSGLSDYINQVGNEKGMSVFITARQHPGETMGSFVIEGLYDFIKSADAGVLLSKYNFIIVPFVNIDGVIKGMHRTSCEGIDYNFAWFRHDVDKINQIKEFIEKKDIVLYFDIHGDEVSKINYLYYTGKNISHIKSLLYDLHLENELMLLHRSKYKYMLKVFFKKHKIVFGIKNTVEYIEKKKGCAGIVYELSAHNVTPEECRIQGHNLGMSLNKFLLTK